MLNHSNIDRSNSVETSPAPFTYESSMRMGSVTLPSDAFISIKVYVEGTYRVPYRIHSIQPDGRINFCDATGQIRVYWQTYPTTEPLSAQTGTYISSLLFNQYSIICGHICCPRTTLDTIRGVIESLQETMLLPADAFVLIPQCHIPLLKGQARSISVNGTYLTGNVVLKAEGIVGTQGVVTAYTDDVLQVSLINTAEEIAKRMEFNTLCAVAIKNKNDAQITGCTCYGKDIIIKSAIESNLRVTREDGKIVLKGVADA